MSPIVWRFSEPEYGKYFRRWIDPPRCLALRRRSAISGRGSWQKQNFESRSALNLHAEPSLHSAVQTDIGFSAQGVERLFSPCSIQFGRTVESSHSPSSLRFDGPRKYKSHRLDNSTLGGWLIQPRALVTARSSQRREAGACASLRPAGDFGLPVSHLGRLRFREP